jgi:hypothetical protein
MKKYEISFRCEKTVDSWDSENGATGSPRFVDEWQKTVISNAKPTRSDLFNFVTDHFGLDMKVHDFFYWPDDDGRFSVNRVEDGNGDADEEGNWLADYDVYIECREISPKLKIGSLGLKSYDK